MKLSRSGPAQVAPANDEFEIAVVAELKHLRTSEKNLQRMYPRLRTTPQLRSQFLEQLAEMQQRAHRLDAVLNPLGAFQAAPASSIA